MVLFSACRSYHEAIATALMLVAGTCLYAAAFKTGGPGVGYLALCIIPIVIGTIAVRCIVAGQRNWQGGYQQDAAGSQHKWSLFWIGACLTLLLCLPMTLFRVRLIDPVTYLYTVLGTEVQCAAVAISAYSAASSWAAEADGYYF